MVVLRTCPVVFRGFNISDPFPKGRQTGLTEAARIIIQKRSRKRLLTVKSCSELRVVVLMALAVPQLAHLNPFDLQHGAVGRDTGMPADDRVGILHLADQLAVRDEEAMPLDGAAGQRDESAGLVSV